MTPKCCENCERLSMDGNCRSNFKTCNQWRTWFRHEWAEIRRAADQIKDKRRRERRDRTRRTAP
jgi:hypothetical protein